MDSSYWQNEYIRFAIILVSSIIGARIVLFIFNRYVKKLTEKTATDLDDLILKIISTPLHSLLILSGAYYAFNTLTVIGRYIVWIDRVVFIVIVYITARVITRILSLLVSRWFHVEKRMEKTPKLVNKIIGIIVFVVAILMVLNYFKVNIGPIIATLGIGGLAIGLALQGTLSNFFAGLNILSDTPFHVGDFIEINQQNISGYVEDIGWRTTRLLTLANTIVIVPNSKLADSIVVNQHLPQHEVSTLVQCGVGYGSDLKRVEQVTLEVAKQIQNAVPGALKSFEPSLRYNTFGDSNINFTVVMRAEKFSDRPLITHEFIKAIKERYNKEGIEISFPVRKLIEAN
jgi:small-conductance mechanosensitive channel